MKQPCVHCGQPIDTDNAPADGKMTCPTCGQPVILPTPAESEVPPVAAAASLPARRFRLTGKDVAIGIGAVVILILLLLLFLRPDQPARRLVFGPGPSQASDNRSPSPAAAPPASQPGYPPSPGLAQGPGGSVGVGSGPSEPGSLSTPVTPVPSSDGGASATGPGAGSGLAGSGGQAPGTPPMTPSGSPGQPDLQSGTPGTQAPGSSADSSGRAQPGGSSPGSPSTPSGSPGQPDLQSGSGTQASGSSAASPGRAQPGGSGPGNSPQGPTTQSAASGSGSPAPSQTTQPAGAPSGTSGGTAGSSPPTASASPSSQTTPAPGGRAAPSTLASSSPQGSPPTTSGASHPTGDPANSGSGSGSATSISAKPQDVAAPSTADLLQLAKNDPAAGTPEEKKPPADSASPISAATLASDAAASDQTATPDMTSAVGTDANKASSLDPNPTGNASDVNPDPFRPFDPRRGSNVVFVLDQSLSMKGEKSTAARRELVKTLQDLGTNQSFYILFFHSSGYDAMPATGMLRATPQNIRSVTNWIHSAGHHWGSDPTKAMLRALELEPDTIWLLSDGAFPAATREMIHLANDGIHAHIYTVGFFSHSGEEVLRQIAQENGGSYHFVPSPKEKQALERALSPSPHTFDNSGPASP